MSNPMDLLKQFLENIDKEDGQRRNEDSPKRNTDAQDEIMRAIYVSPYSGENPTSRSEIKGAKEGLVEKVTACVSRLLHTFVVALFPILSHLNLNSQNTSQEIKDANNLLKSNHSKLLEILIGQDKQIKQLREDQSRLISLINRVNERLESVENMLRTSEAEGSKVEPVKQDDKDVSAKKPTKVRSIQAEIMKNPKQRKETKNEL